MDERWSLEDLYDFPHAYSQTYSLIYCLDSPLDPRSADRINIALEGYPWQGGYSYVNIYTVLRNQIPHPHRPQIKSIHYASPGWIDIILNPDVALLVAKSVGILLGTALTAAETYKRIYKTISEINKQRKKNNLDNSSLSAAEARMMMQMSEDIARHLGFKSFAQLNSRTKNPEVTLKILLAHYRRLRTLADFVESGKIRLPEKLKEEG